MGGAGGWVGAYPAKMWARWAESAPPAMVVMARAKDMVAKHFKTCIDYPSEINGLVNTRWPLVTHV